LTQPPIPDPSALRSPHHRGDVPTPPALARRLAEGLHAPPEPEAFGASPGSAAAPPPGPGPWLDPACGEGALLLAALEVHGGDPRELCFGIDTDPEKLRRARERLARQAGLTEWDLAGNFTLADALDPATPWAPGTHLLANPPWVSFSGRHAAPDSAAALPHHRGPGRWPALHAAFLERAARHLAEHGTQGRFLLPASIAELDGYAALRDAVEAHAHLVEPPQWLDEDCFPGVHEPALLLHLAAGPRADGPAWSAARSDDVAPLLEALDRFPRVPEGTFADAGLHTGNVADQLVFRSPGEGRAPLRIGRDLTAFALAPARRYMDTQLATGAGRRFRRKPLEVYRGFPVLLRQTADRPIAALHEPADAFRNSLLAARPIPGLDPAVLVAVLNHPIAARLHRGLFADARQRSFPQVKIGHLKEQRLPFARRREAPELHDELARRVRALRPEAPGFEAERVQLERLVSGAFGLPAAGATGPLPDPPFPRSTRREG
jgi:hypothetical protein